MTFQQFLESRNIDQQTLTPELRAALVKQWQASEFSDNPPEQPTSILVIGDDIEERWSRAVRLPAC